MNKKVVIVGAGYAGINAALTLLKKKKKQEDIEITIIDKNSYHTLLTELHEIAANRIDDKAAAIPLVDIFRNTGVRVVKDEVRSFDFEKKIVKSRSVEYPYDYLVLAMGSEPNYYGIQGLKEHSFPLWSNSNAIALKNHIINCFAKASIEANPAIRKKLLTFVVGGGGFSGVEMIGELANWNKTLCKDYGIAKDEVRLILVEALPRILVNLSEKTSEKATLFMTKWLKIDVRTNSKIVNVTKDSLEIAEGETIETSTVIWTAGVKAACISDEINIAKGKLCRILVDKNCQTKHPNVYATGDISLYDDEKTSHVAIVETAIQTSANAAKNILADIRNTQKQELKLKMSGIMVSIGFFYAVAELFGKRIWPFLAVKMKHLVLWHYLFEIGGVKLIIDQFKKEVYYKNHHLTIVEKHLGPVTQAFWLLPLRLYLAYFWIMSGFEKINNGWFTEALLTAQKSDGWSSASIQADGKSYMNIIGDHTPFFYEWFAQNVVVPNALLFQYMIILTELFIGLAFLGGAFTLVAAVAAIGMNINFMLSTGMNPATYWMIPAQIAMMAGAGRSFGLDYYIIPYVQEVTKVWWQTFKPKLCVRIKMQK